MYFKAFNKIWPCEYVDKGNHLDEAAFEAKTGRKAKVAVVKVCSSMEKEWLALGEDTKLLIILEDKG